MDKLSTLNQRETRELTNLQRQYVQAKEVKNYAVSDELRAKLDKAGFWPPYYDVWHPVHEDSAHREHRAAMRYMYGED